MYEEEDARTVAESLTRSFSNFMRAMPAIAKVASMGADRIFYATKFAAWVYVVEDGLSTDFGVALAVTLSTAAIIDNTWGRGFSMYRRELAKAKNTNGSQNRNPTRDADWFYPGVDTNFWLRTGYIAVQGFCGLYMMNSIPGSYLNSFATAKLGARLTGSTFNAFCDPSRDKSPASSGFSIAMAHLWGTFLGYSTISSFLSYNLPQIRFYYYQLFILGEISKIDRWTWWETIPGVLINTCGIAFAGQFAWELLEQESFCHAGVDEISDRFIFYWKLQACITNMVMNGMMTLYAVHMRRTNQHELDRAALARDIDMSLELDFTIRTAIIINSFAAFCATEVFIPGLPGTEDKQLKYLAYSPALIILALPLARVSFLNQYALSSESDIFERLNRKKEIEHKVEIELEELLSLEEEAARFLDDDDDEIEQTNNIYDMNNDYGSFDYISNNNISHTPTPVPQKSIFSSVSRYFFFQSADEKPAIISADNAEHFAHLRIDVNNRFNLPDESSSETWGCNIM